MPLGTGALSVGVVEGIAEVTVAVSNVFSSAISDWLGRRNRLLLLGYGLAALTKLVMVSAGGAADYGM